MAAGVQRSRPHQRQGVGDAVPNPKRLLSPMQSLTGKHLGAPEQLWKQFLSRDTAAGFRTPEAFPADGGDHPCKAEGPLPAWGALLWEGVPGAHPVPWWGSGTGLALDTLGSIS